MLVFELNKPIDISICKFVRNRTDKDKVVGIYKITSPTGKINIGQSTNVENRFTQYKSLSCKGQSRLYNSFKKYGVKNHIFEIIYLCNKEELNDLEDYYVKFYDTFNTPHGLNLKEGGGNRGKHSDETKKILSEIRKNKLFLSYNECKKWVNENELTKNIKSSSEWFKITKQLPLFIPKAPTIVYAQQKTWKGWGDFLGTGKVHKGNFLIYEEAKKWVEENDLTKDLKSSMEWENIKNNLPSFIPKTPDYFFKKQNTWRGWGDFLRTGNKKEYNFYSFNETKIWIKNSQLTKYIKTENDWSKISNKLPPFIPKAPKSWYSKTDEWKGWGDFLGTWVIAPQKRIYYDYEKCKYWIHNNYLTKDIKKRVEWSNFNRENLPPFIPKDPATVYKNKGWKGWGDFFGTGNKREGDFLIYEEAKKWIKENELTKNVISVSQWNKIKNKLPSIIPKDPKGFYERQNVWKSWGDFLNTGVIANQNRVYLNYEECKTWLKNNNLTKNLKSYTEWRIIKNKLPNFIPKQPSIVFKNKGWLGWGDFLDTGNIHKGNFLNYEDAKNWIEFNELTKNIKSENSWKKIKHKLPFFIPKYPQGHYNRKKTWKGWGDFLRTGNKRGYCKK